LNLVAVKSVLPQTNLETIVFGRIVARSDLNPAVKIKISRARVYGMMAVTILTGACAYTGTAYWGRLRKYLT